METLKLEELAGYLPYQILCTANDGCFKEHPLMGLIEYNSTALFDFETGEQEFRLSDFKPLVIPLSELTKVQLRGAGFTDHIDYLTHELQDPKNAEKLDYNGQPRHRIGRAPYEMIQWLIKNHFDVFNWIDRGLALNKLQYGK